ncbi:MAG: hypothetical protein ACLRPT_09325 [Akkermansia muciniphila]
MMLLNGLFLFPLRSPRLHSLDALRGLDMLIILGLTPWFCSWLPEIRKALFFRKPHAR